MSDLEETQVDGVQCYYVETHRPTLGAILAFRCGSADEPAFESGWQHLVEHLALEGRGGGVLDVNGQVSLLDTSFQVHGPHEEVVRVLAELCGWLVDPDLSMLEREADVLRSEALVRGISSTAVALGMRYGARGPGLASFREAALGRTTAERLRARIISVFTRENAVLMLDGRPPDSLHLPLPVGERKPIPPAIPCEEARPAAYTCASGVAVSGEVARTSGMFIAHDLLRESMTEHFRFQQGSSYAPWSSYEPVDAEVALIVGGTDVKPSAIAPVAEQMMLLVKTLASRKPSRAALEMVKAARVQAISDPYNRFGLALRAGSAHMAGRAVTSLQAQVDEVRSIGPGDVQQQWQRFAETLLLAVPQGATRPLTLPWLEQPTTTTAPKGRSYRSVNWPGDRRRLVLGDDLVAVSALDGTVSATSNEIAVVLAYDDGLRTVVRNDGYLIGVDPFLWRDGDDAVARLDNLVPEERVAPQERLRVMPPRRRSLVRRWGHAALRVVARRYRGMAEFHARGHIGAGRLQ